MTEASDKTPSQGLPTPVSTFVGRLGERAALVELIGRERLVALCGPPGVGKTRLAAEVANIVAPNYGRVWWVDLTAAPTAGDLVPTMARALGVQEQPDRCLIEVLLDVLRDQTALVVLDNCEHLVEACSAVAQDILESCTRVTILATSRQPLAIAGERQWDVAPLDVPVPGADPRTVAASEAVQLFLARVASINPAFVLDPRTAGPVATICSRLDGIPLAVELAAARLSVLSVHEVAAGLDDRFAVLGRAQRPLGGRHQTLAETLDWSYGLLDEAEQVLFRRLGVFVGDFTLDAIRAVCGGGPVPPEAVLDTLASLVTKSLVVADTSITPARYRMLETLRVYAVELLRAGDEGDLLVERHTSHFLALAESAAPQLTGPHQLVWLARLDADWPNVRVAMESALADPIDDRPLRLATSLTLYCRLRGVLSAGRRWLERALDCCPDAPPALRTDGMWGTGFLALMLLDLDAAGASLDQSFAGYRDEADVGGQARTLLLAGHRQLLVGGDPTSIFEQSVSLAREAGDSWCLAHALAFEARMRLQRGETVTARQLLDDGLATARQAGDAQGQRMVLVTLGELLVMTGDYRRADERLGEGLRISLALGDAVAVARALEWLALSAVAQGHYERGGHLMDDCVEVVRSSGASDSYLPRCALANLNLMAGHPEQARGIYQSALTVPGRPEAVSAVLGLARVAIIEGDVAGARSRIDRVLLAAAESPWMVAAARHALGALERLQGEVAHARSHVCEAIKLRDRIGDLPGLLESLELLGGLAVESGDHEKAVRLLAAAAGLRQSRAIGRQGGQVATYESDLARAREALPDEDFEAAWTEGTQLSSSEIAAYALQGRGKRPKRPPSGWDSLTRAEEEVLRLVADGLTNAQIAERLFVSTHTAKWHVASTLAKLGLGTRVELAREFGRREGLAAAGAGPTTPKT